MAIGVPSTNQIIPFSPEALQYASKQGMYGSIPKVVYAQYGATGAVSTTGVTLFNNSATTARGTLTFPAGSLNWNNGYDPAGGAPNLTGPGAIIRIHINGAMTTSGSPAASLLIKFNSTTLSTLPATTLPVVTALPFEIDIDIAVGTYAVAGSVTASGFLRFSSSATLAAANIAYFPLTTTGSFDTTIANILDITTTGTITTTAFTVNNAYVTFLN